MKKRAVKMRRNIIDAAWVVVEVRSGIPESVRLFHNIKAARTYDEKLRSELNLDNDETGIFRMNLSKGVMNEAA